MDPTRYASVAHAEHDILSPISLSKIDRVIDLLELRPEAQVLDLGCGKAEVLIRICERYGCGGIGVEPTPSFVAGARAEAATRLRPGQVRFEEVEPWEFEVDNESYDLVVVMDQHPWGTFRDTLAQTWARVRSGGQVVLGERFWRGDPPVDYLDFLGVGPEHRATHEGNVALALKESFTPLYACTACQDEIDHFEGMSIRAVERYLRANPGDDYAPAFRERVHALRDGYLRWGRDAEGFGVYLLLK